MLQNEEGRSYLNELIVKHSNADFVSRYPISGSNASGLSFMVSNRR